MGFRVENRNVGSRAYRVSSLVGIADFQMLVGGDQTLKNAEGKMTVFIDIFITMGVKLHVSRLIGLSLLMMVIVGNFLLPALRVVRAHVQHNYQGVVKHRDQVKKERYLGSFGLHWVLNDLAVVAGVK